MAKARSEYYDTFSKMIEYSYEAALFLQDTLQNFDRSQLQQKRHDLHEIEHRSDEVKHDMMSKLAKEFITPIEREDIIELAQEIDNITDRIEDVLLRVYMYNFQEIRQDTLRFAATIVEACDKLRSALKLFHNFRKSTEILPLLIEVNTLESEADTWYIDAVHRLFLEQRDPLETFAWTTTYDYLEKCCDACEHAADVIECVIMKNS